MKKNFKIATEVINAGNALARNFAINQTKKILLERGFVPNYNSTQATNAQNAIIECNENNALSLFGLPLFDTLILSYAPTNQSYTFNIAQIETTNTKNIITT